MPKEQRPVRLRTPRVGEKGIVVAETTDQPFGEKPTVFYIASTNAATGAINSRLWFCRFDYPRYKSFKELQEAWREEKERLGM